MTEFHVSYLKFFSWRKCLKEILKLLVISCQDQSFVAFSAVNRTRLHVLLFELTYVKTVPPNVRVFICWKEMTSAMRLKCIKHTGCFSFIQFWSIQWSLTYLVKLWTCKSLLLKVDLKCFESVSNHGATKSKSGLIRHLVDSTLQTCPPFRTKKHSSSDSDTQSRSGYLFPGGSVHLSGRWQRPSPAPWSVRSVRPVSPTATRLPPTRDAQVPVKTRGLCVRDTSSASSAKFASAAGRKDPCDGNQVSPQTQDRIIRTLRQNWHVSTFSHRSALTS